MSLKHGAVGGDCYLGYPIHKINFNSMDIETDKNRRKFWEMKGFQFASFHTITLVKVYFKIQVHVYFK
jgi:hypothetical protein